jgi:hypothetical protein
MIHAGLSTDFQVEDFIIIDYTQDEKNELV